ncbi:hypothetical protein CRYUN_Cryun20dG0106100 [Craigia yunnanensis]
MGSRKGSDNDGASPGKIFIGGLAKDTTLETFTKYFEKYGEITDFVIMKDRHTGRPRGFGFITFADPSVVDTVMQEDHVINGKQVEIKRTIPKGSSQSNDFKTKKIFVGGIPTSVTEDELKNFFSKYGKVVEHEIIRDHATKRSRGFGFIVFDSEKVVDNMLANGNMIDMEGTQVEIKKAEPKKASNPAPGPAYGSESRARSYNDGFGGFGDYGGFGGDGGFGPAPYRSFSRFGDYGGYVGGVADFGGSYGGFGGGGGGFPGYRGDSSFGYSSRFGSYAGGLSGIGIGAYGRGGGGYGSYGGSGSSTVHFCKWALSRRSEELLDLHVFNLLLREPKFDGFSDECIYKIGQVVYHSLTVAEGTGIGMRREVIKMEGLVSLKTTPGISSQSFPSFNHRPNFFLRCSSLDLPLRRFNFPAIRAQQSETISPKKEKEEDALKVKEWEVGMFQNEVAASQGIRIRRRPPTDPPLHYMGPFEFRLQNEGNTPRNILEEIVWYKDTEVSQMKEKKPLAALKKVMENAPPTRDFVGALKAAHSRTGLPALIAEVKKASPSRGILRENFDPVEIARAYEKGGTACLSVLTDEKYFKGSFENLEAIRNAGVKCPLLCKEFVVDAWQIYYARIKGADAILLIAAVLPDLDIRYMIKICKMLGLAALVEVHDEREMDRVLGIEGIELIGINNRNLETFEVDISNTKKLLEGERGQIIRQKNIIVVGESGLFTPDDVAYVQEAGVKAVLVGESIVKQSDPGKGITGLFGRDISL